MGFMGIEELNAIGYLVEKSLRMCPNLTTKSQLHPLILALNFFSKKKENERQKKSVQEQNENSFLTRKLLLLSTWHECAYFATDHLWADIPGE